MINLGLRLAVSGGRAALARLGLITAAVAIGVGLLLLTLAGVNAVQKQNARYAWLTTGASATGTLTQPDGVSGSLWWGLTADTFDDTIIGRVDVAATGPDSPIPPGIPRLPGSGEYFASPDMAKLLAVTPRAQLGARYPGRLVGIIGDAALPAPDSLLIVVGHSPSELADSGHATKVTSISAVSPSNCNGPSCAVGVGINDNGMVLVLGVVALAILLPVLVFIGTATRLSAASREQRFAAMRLIGATPRQVTRVSLVEASVGAVIGVGLGFAVFYAARVPVAGLPFTGAPFFPSDMSLTLVNIVAVVFGVPVAAAVAARIALRRVHVSPLGVTRRVTPKPPRAWRVIPLFAGIGDLTYFAIAGRPDSTNGQLWAYFGGFCAIAIGLILAGPWLTQTGARLLASRAQRPTALMAGRRLADDPRAGFRAVSGLVLGLFVTSVAVGVITTIVAYTGGSGTTTAQSSTLIKPFYTHPDDLHVSKGIAALPDGLLAHVTAIPGVRGVAVVHDDSSAIETRANTDGLVSCAQLATTPVIGRCAEGAQTVNVQTWFGARFGQASDVADRVWQPSSLTPSQVASLPVRTLVVQTDGSTAAIESARTTIERAAPDWPIPETLSSIDPQNGRLLQGYRQLANVVILLTLPIAGSSLAVATVAGLNDRKRPFSLLRLTGMPLTMLRRVVAMETAVPLVITSAVSLGAGFLAAHLFLRTQLDETLQSPGWTYYVVVAAALVAALGIIASTMPLLRRITGPETARNE